jgi:outer membrane protein assembly factor BamB
MYMRFYVLFAIPFLACGSDWPRFRGPNGAGISPDRGLPAELSRDRNVLWKAKTPKGHSSPIVVSGRVLITGYEGEQRVLLCYDSRTGALLWRQSVARTRSEIVNPINGPATPTPATDGRSVLVYFPEYGLIAYSLEGKERWRAPLGPFGSIQGMAVSPIVVEGNVVLLVDTPEEAFLSAFDTRTGKQAWKVDRPIGWLGSYTTPSIYKPANGPAQIIVAGAVELTGYQAKTGERLWWVRGVTMGPAALPLVAGDSVYTLEPASGTGSDDLTPFSSMAKPYDKNQDGKVQLSEVSGENLHDKIMYRVFKSIDRISGNGDGVVTEEEFNRAFNSNEPGGGLVRTRIGGSGDITKQGVAWRHTKSIPYVLAPLLYDGVLYMIRGGGILTTLDPETGKVLREERLKNALGDYYAQPVAGDGKIYFVSQEGKLSVIKAGKSWEMLSSSDLAEEVIATPAIAQSRIYVRTDGTLYCFTARPARS